MESINAALILKALDGLSMRAVATSQNIANANSPGYRPVKVTFEDTLRAASTKGTATINKVIPQMSFAVDAVGNSPLRLDLELATAASTSGRYAALIEVLSRQLQIQSLALSSAR